MERRVNIRGIIFRDSELFAQTIKHPSGESDYWCTPGGGLEAGESLLQGLSREMIEETGVEPKIGKLLFIHQFHDGTKEQVEFFFHIRNTKDYESVDLAATTHGNIEIQRTGFIKPSNHYLLPAFLQTIDIQEYIENDKPVLISSTLP